MRNNGKTIILFLRVKKLRNPSMTLAVQVKNLKNASTVLFFGIADKLFCNQKEGS